MNVKIKIICGCPRLQYGIRRNGGLSSPHSRIFVSLLKSHYNFKNLIFFHLNSFNLVYSSLPFLLHIYLLRISSSSSIVSVSFVIIYMKKLLDSDLGWLRAVQIKRCNTGAKSVTPVQITPCNSGL